MLRVSTFMKQMKLGDVILKLNVLQLNLPEFGICFYVSLPYNFSVIYILFAFSKNFFDFCSSKVSVPLAE